MSFVNAKGLNFKFHYTKLNRLQKVVTFTFQNSKPALLHLDFFFFVFISKR